MFGVRIIAFAATLFGAAAFVPLDLAEAKPRSSSEGDYSNTLRKSYAKQHSRKSYAKPQTRKSYSRHAGRTQAQTTRKSFSQIQVTASASARLGARPSRWCGWWMRSQLGGGPELNLARNWKNWGRPSGPQVGAVVVWSSHVGIITGRTSSGQWVVKSGNDGGRVRERPRSVAGAVFRVGSSAG
jgi:hypothetical protein